MNIYHNEWPVLGATIVVVGSFDGVHSGHRRLIDQLNFRADQLGLIPIVITFDPHPRLVLRGENRLLTTVEERLILFDQAGVRNVIVAEFSHDFAAIEARDFIQHYLVEKLGARAIFTGEGHTFGNHRSGDDKMLVDSGLTVIHIERYDDISSTSVRSAVASGDMELAAKLLGGHYLVITPIKDCSKLLPVSGSYLCDNDRVTVRLSVDQILDIKERMNIRIKKRV